MSGVIKEMSQVISLTVVIEMFGKFTSIISLDSCDSKRSYGNKLLKEITTISRGVRFIAASKSESGSQVNGGKNIAFNTISKDRDGVHLDKITGVLWSKTLSAGFRSVASRRPVLPCMMILLNLGILPTVDSDTGFMPALVQTLARIKAMVG